MEFQNISDTIIHRCIEPQSTKPFILRAMIKEFMKDATYIELFGSRDKCVEDDSSRLGTRSRGT
jgi:hypothetical protein